MTAVLALSLSSEIEKYGAYAGIAAVVGLGVLSLLYFAQAREVKRLREWAGRAPERDADLQQRVVAEAQVRTAAPQPRPRPAGPATPAGVAAAKPTAPAAGPPVLAAHPGTPAGAKPVPATAAAAAATGAAAAAVTAAAKPAAAAATPPASTTVPVSKTAPGPAAGAPAAAAGVPGAPPAAAPGTPPPATAAAQAPPATPSAVPTATPAAAVSGTPAPPAPAAAAPATPAASAPTGTPTPPPPRSRPRPAAAPVRATRPDAGVAARAGAETPHQGSRRSLLGVILGGVAIIAIAVLLITQVFSGGSDNSAKPKPNSVGAPAATPGTGGASATPLPDRVGTRVAVLNGTPVAGLARAAADKLTAVGYKDVSPVATDTTNQTRATTVVYWQSGTRREGLDVAKALGLGRAALQVMDQNARVLGGGAPLVVVVGADQAK